MYERIDNPSSINPELIEEILFLNKIPTIQFSKETYDQKLLKIINPLCIKYGDKLSIRFYSHGKNGFDCSWLDFLPNVSNLYLDCLQSIKSKLSIEKLNNLKEFGIGVSQIDDTEFLSRLNFDNIERLLISDTQKNNFDLSSLSRCHKLIKLNIVGHTKGIESVGSLSNLRYLTLTSIPKKQKLEFVNSIHNLKRLTILLGGRENIDEINNANIEELEITRVRGLDKLDHIERFLKIEILSVEDQIRLKCIVFKKTVPSLKYLRVINCKELNDIKGINKLQNIKHLRINRTNIDAETFINKKFPPTLKTLAIYSSAKVDKKIRRILNERGYSE